MRDDSDQKKDGSILNDYNTMEGESCFDDVFLSLTYDLIKDTPVPGNITGTS